jgi:hypothetical protein
MSKKIGDSGGAAAIRGFAFQNGIAAWIATGILGEQAVSPRWDLPADVYYTFLRCETEQPVDDILLGTSDERLIFIQVKRYHCAFLI